MSLVGYLQTHLAGAEAGSRLFKRYSRTQQDPETRAALRDMHQDLLEEKEWLRSVLEAAGSSENPVLSTLTVVGQKVRSLVPHGNPLHRTATDDLVELEELRIAVGGRLAGFDAMLAVADQHSVLERSDVEHNRAQAIEHLARLTTLHTRAAARAL